MDDNNKSVLYIRADGIYNDSRATKEILTLLRAGFFVYVLGWDRDGVAEHKCNVVFSDYSARVSFNFYLKAIQGSAGTNLWTLYGWLKFVKRKVKKLRSVINVVHACDLDSVLLSYRAIKRYNIKLVYDIYDYYIDSHYYLPKPLLFLLEKFEINIINVSDVCIICTEERIAQLSKAKPNNVIVIHNAPDVQYVKNKNIYDYFYCGSLCSNRLLGEFFVQYANNSDLKVAIGGYGEYEKEAKDNDKKYNNFVYLGPLSYSECLEYESKSACLSAIYEPSIRNHQLCAPNKFYESLALGKPIIVCRGTGIDKIVEEYNIGFVIDYNAIQLYGALRKILKYPEESEKMGQRARRLYEEKYNWRIMSERLVDVYSALISS